MQLVESAEGILRIVVRIVGIALVLVGSWIGVSTVEEAWDLYRDPARVERFALAIEQGSGIDSTLDSATGGAGERNSGFRPSYFLSWIVAVVLLLLVAKIAVWIVATGGRLTLYEARARAFNRALAQELADNRER